MRQMLSRDSRVNRIGTVAVVGLLASGLAFAATKAEGYKANEVTLHDGGIWVTRGHDNQIGRLNTDLGKIDTSIDAANGSDLAQIEGTVIVSQPDNVGWVEVALGRFKAGPRFDAQIQVDIGGHNGALLVPETGQLFLQNREAIAAIDKEKSKSVSVAGASLLVVSDSGEIHAVDTVKGVDHRFATPEQESPSDHSIVVLDGHEAAVTTVGDTLIVLDRTSKLLYKGDQKVADLSELGDQIELRASMGAGIVGKTSKIKWDLNGDDKGDVEGATVTVNAAE
ncbi:MAG: hypothetical protein ABMA25_14890, partial [Ilumatobacteraceae bacterium]